MLLTPALNLNAEEKGLARKISQGRLRLPYAVGFLRLSTATVQQSVTGVTHRRASAALLLLKKEVELCKLQADIGKRVEEKISKDQRRYFLMEQLRSIKRELGMEKDDKSAVVQK